MDYKNQNMRTKHTQKSHYLNTTFSHEDYFLKTIREFSESENVSYMQISAYEGGILQFLCHALKVQKAIEIGTLYGYSSLMIARTLPPNGKLFTLDINQKRQQKAKQLMQQDPHSQKINFITGPALESLKKLENQAPFDMVFIDADKRAYLDYLNWAYKNLKSGGLIIADNTFLFGALYQDSDRKTDTKALQVMQQFNKELTNTDLYISSTLIPTEEGLTVGIKK